MSRDMEWESRVFLRRLPLDLSVAFDEVLDLGLVPGMVIQANSAS